MEIRAQVTQYVTDRIKALRLAAADEPMAVSPIAPAGPANTDTNT